MRITKTNTTINELIGVNVWSLTFETHLENGNPLSRAKAKTCRDVDAIKFVTLSMIKMIIMLVMAIAPFAEPVAVMNSSKNAYPDFGFT